MKELAKLWCFIFGHNYKLKRIISRSIKEVECTCCHQEWGMNSSVESFLPMDDELRELHDDILNA